MTHEHEADPERFFTAAEIVVLREQMQEMAEKAMRAQALRGTGPHPRLVAAKAAHAAKAASKAQE